MRPLEKTETRAGSDDPRTIFVAAEPRSASVARAFVRTHAATAGFDPDSIAEIEVAAGEAVTNAILYGRPDKPVEQPFKIRITADSDGDRFFVEVQDPGPGFDPRRVHQSGTEDTDAAGGRGLYLMQALMDHVEMRIDPAGMMVRMERRLPGR